MHIASANPPLPAGEGDGPDRYFIADGARLRYRDEGSGPPLVLVHGWTLDLDMWEPQVAALRGEFRIVRLDRRGFGLSSGRASISQDAADLGSLCRHLKIDRVALAGMSQGARAVLGFARSAPHRISCLILDGPPEDGRKIADPASDVPLAHYRSLIRTEGIEAFRREWAAHPLVSLITADPQMHGILNAMIRRYPGTDLDESGGDGDAAPPCSAMDGIDAPVLVITGDHDLPSRVHAADDLARRSMNAERAVIQSAGHLPNLDNPNGYNAVVRAFLERHAASLR
jgi:pimeloyl-ACP methyl ester carboxylesterase